jgi:phage gpG-like protein
MDAPRQIYRSLKVDTDFDKKSLLKVIEELKALENSIDSIGSSTPGGSRVEFEPDFSEAYELLAEIGARGSFTAPVFPVLKKQIQFMNAANFATNGLPVGGWKPLDAKYAAWKSIRFPGAPTMVRTGALMESLTTTPLVQNETLTSFEIGTAIPYARFHQTGTFKMPKRQVVYEPVGFAEFASGIVANYVAGISKVPGV